MIEVAIEAAKAAGDLALKLQQEKALNVKFKPDKSPVTAADVEAEKLIRRIISKRFPEHGIIGEELPPVNPKAQYQWVIDPVDGTKEFVRGIKTWCTLLAVLEDNHPTLGIAYFPYSNEIFTAQKNKGTLLNGKKTRVSSTGNVKLSGMSYGSVDRFKKQGRLENLVTICSLIQSRRSLSTLGYNHFWKGQLDFILEPGGGIHDFAAPAIITQEAGGIFSDFNGKFSLTSGNAIMSNTKLFNQVLKILNEK